MLNLLRRLGAINRHPLYWFLLSPVPILGAMNGRIDLGDAVILSIMCFGVGSILEVLRGRDGR